VTYTYDSLGQLKTALGYENGGAARLHEKFGYLYDAAGNLSKRTNNALVQTFGVNSLNQLTNGTRSGTLTVAGTTTSAATNVTVNSQTAARYGDNTFAREGFALSDGNNAFTAIAQDSLGRGDTNAVTVNLPATVSFTYDQNGNLTADGRRTLAYDDENQLVSVIVTNGSGSSTKSEFSYDGLFRRRVRKEYTWSSGIWNLASEIHYLYDGRLVLQERDANNLPLVSYTRGLDLSGTREGAGGIGGLLARTDHGSGQSAFYHADANGNITALVNGAPAIVARYSYDPYGNLLAKSGAMADANLYRFSSKETHTSSGLIYYGFRFYDPNLQRWLNRDPIGEAGGVNLYAFLGNNPISFIDPLGLLEYYWDGQQMLIIYPSWWQFWRRKPDVYLVHPDLARKILRAKGIEDTAVDAACALAALELQKKLLADQEKRQTPSANCPKPPDWTPDWEWGPPTGEKEGDWRWFDPEGAEWRRHSPDKWHRDPHWDYNPWDNWNSPWRNVDDQGNYLPTPTPPTTPAPTPPVPSN